ncbi:MAG: hypothetical protein VB065_12875 [Eubacteriales bacterium]|nr:hypothetical protein [Christensenellaceae bacterium]MEA5066931.1 hypothetical protein [Eubacteriales bacterium]
MAYLKTLSENWTLKGGVFDPFPIEGALEVRRALIRQGLLQPRPVGLDALAEAWIYRCRWVYETAFDWSDEDERCQLECEYMAGAGKAVLNGRAYPFEAGKLLIDCSEAAIPGENRLSISFEPASPGQRRIGPLGAVKLRAGVGMTLEGFELTAKDEAIISVVRLHAHAAGRYQFRYVVALADEAVGNFEFAQSLRPGAAEVSHALSVPGPTAYDPQKADDTLYTVRLSIERMGVGCQLAFGQAAFDPPGPTRIVRVPADITREEIEARLPLLRQLGVDGLAASDGRALPYAPSLGFCAYAGDGEAREVDASAPLEGEDMHLLSGGEKYWPPGGPVWRLTDSRWPDEWDFEALFGTNALGDMARAARLARFLQAEKVRRQAYAARIADKPALIDWPFEMEPKFAGNALVEFSGEARPAYDALQEAWAPIAVCIALPDDMQCVRPGVQLNIGAMLLGSRGLRKETLKVEIACRDGRGALLGAITLPAMLGASPRAGSLAVTMPEEEGVAVVRVVASREGEVVAQSDWTLSVCAALAPLAPLMTLKAAQLTQKHGRLVNEGDEVALGVCSLGYRALLPGEEMRAGDTYECLNGLL